MRDNAQIAPDSAVSERILQTVLQEEARRIPSIAPRQKTRKLWRRVIAVAACLAVTVGAGWTVLRLSAPSAPPVATPTQSVRYDEVYSLIHAIRKEEAKENGGLLGSISDGLGDLFGGTREMDMMSGADMEYVTESVTQTNTQYADVDEADIVKTDGQYLYVLDELDQTVSIVKADGVSTAVEATIDLSGLIGKTADKEEQTLDLHDLYYVSDRLVVLYNLHQYRRYLFGDSTRYVRTVAGVAVYDVSDRAAPLRLATVGQDGNLVDSRVVDGVLYLVTDYWVENEKNGEIETYIPRLYRDGKSDCVAEPDLTVMANPDSCNYTVVSAVSLTGEVKRLSQKAVFGSGSGLVYANTQHLLLAKPRSESDSTDTPLDNGHTKHESFWCDYTDLSLFSLTDGQIAHVADGTIEGYLDGQFAIDEYKGYFRIAATRNSFKDSYISTNGGDDALDCVYEETQDNALYVLDGTLREVGRVEDLAPDEQVKSVRFDGDIGYVVTYRQTDPLFAIDLSDPTAPKVLSALKITGFSEYLHPLSENRLLGFGYAGTQSGSITGLQLTMFDTTNKGDVTVHRLFKLSQYSYSEALYDHHAILVDAERRLIGFPAYGETSMAYLLFTYDEEGGFALKARLGMSGATEQRGIWIGDTFYLCSADHVYAYQGDGFTRVAAVIL